MKFNLKIFFTVAVTAIFLAPVQSEAQCTLVIDSVYQSTAISCDGLCDGEVTVAYTGDQGSVSFQWFNSLGVDLGLDTAVAYGQCADSLSVIVSDAVCSKDSFYILMNPAPVIAAFDVSDSAFILPASVNFTNTSTGAANYEWNFGDSASTTSNAVDTSFLYGSGGVYTVTLVAINGNCTDTITKTIEAYGEPSVTMPNVFTPNNDGVNDVFRPIMTSIESVEGAVFNRFGEKVYVWFGKNSYWDGYTHPAGLPAPEGVYYYVLSFVDMNGDSYEKQGVIYLIR